MFDDSFALGSVVLLWCSLEYFGVAYKNAELFSTQRGVKKEQSKLLGCKYTNAASFQPKMLCCCKPLLGLIEITVRVSLTHGLGFSLCDY